MVHINSLVMEKIQLNHLPIVSLWELSVAMAINQEADPHYFSYFELPLPEQHLYQIRVILLQCFEGVPFFFFLNLMLAWQLNKEADHHNFSYFELPLPKQHSNQVRDK